MTHYAAVGFRDQIVAVFVTQDAAVSFAHGKYAVMPVPIGTKPSDFVDLETGIVRTLEQELRDRKQYQSEHEIHARRSGFIVRAALMFNVKPADVTQEQYNKAVEDTQRDTVPKWWRT